MKDEWNLKKAKEVALMEWDADVFHWDKKTGERTIIEMQNELMIPENSIRKKGIPRYKRAILKDDIEILRQQSIKRMKNAVEVYSREWLMSVAVEKIINELFGIEEKKEIKNV